MFSKLHLLKGPSSCASGERPQNCHPSETLFGTYVFLYSTFELRNAGAAFQILMDDILENLPYCICYVDDILSFSKRESEHHDL